MLASENHFLINRTDVLRIEFNCLRENYLKGVLLFSSSKGISILINDYIVLGWWSHCL